MRVGFLDDFLPAGNVEETGDLLVDVPFPNGARQRHDVLARVVGDEKARRRLQFLGGFRDIAQLEVGDFAGERQIARAVEQAAVIAVPTPRQDERGDFHDLVAFRAHGIEHHQLLQHPVRWKFIRCEVGEGEIADFPAGPGVFQEFQRLGLGELLHITLRLIRVRCPPVTEIGEGFQGRCAGRHFLSPKFLQRHCVPGDGEQLIVTLLLPVLKRILVKQVQVFGDLRLPEHLLVLLRTRADHPRHERGRGRQMVGRQRQAFRVEIIDGQVAVGMDDDGTRALLDRRGIDAVGKPFLNDDRVTEITFGLGEQVANGHGLAGAGHSQ